MSSVAEFPTLLSTEEAARVLGITPQSVRRLIRRGQLPALRLGRGPQARIRIKRESLVAFLIPDPTEEAA